MSLTSLDTRPNLAPPTMFLVGKFGLALLHWGEIICGSISAVPIKLLRRALYDDGQMINSNVTNHVTNTRVEFVFNKHSCCWRAEMWRLKSVLEDIDSTFILKEEQRNAIKAFEYRKDILAVLPTGSGKSLMYQLVPWSTVWSYYVGLIGSTYI